MAGLSIVGGENSKPVNNDGSEHRHPDNISPIAAPPVAKSTLIIAKSPEKEDDNGKDKMEKDIYKSKVGKTSDSYAKPLGGQMTGKTQGDR